MRIYETSDRIPVKIGGIEFKVSPLTYNQKMTISSCVKTVSGKDIFDSAKAAYHAIRFCLKEVSGLKNSKGDYALEFDENDILTEKCLDDIMNIEAREKLSMVALSLLTGVPDKIINPATGEEIEGIEFNNPKSKVVVKK